MSWIYLIKNEKSSHLHGKPDPLTCSAVRHRQTAMRKNITGILQKLPPSHTAGRRTWGRRRPVLLSVTSGSALITLNSMAMWQSPRGWGKGQKSPPGTWESQTLGEKERSYVPEHTHSNMWGGPQKSISTTALTRIPNISSKYDSNTAGLTMHGF